MKRTMAVLLVALMALCLAACGGQTDPVGSIDEDLQQAGQNQNDTLQDEADPAPAFDTSWADNEFELQIPEPTFEEWEVSAYTEGSQWRVDANRAYYDATKTYADSLRDAGFSLNEEENDDFDGLAYIFRAENPSGYHVDLIFEADNTEGLGHAALTLTK